MSTYSNEVIVIGETGNFIGKMTYKQAQETARAQGLDLVQMSHQNGVPVCKIIDEGKWKYEQKKKMKSQKHNPETKDICFGLRIAEHDENVKLKHINELLIKGHDVRITVEMTGREKSHPDWAFRKLNAIINKLDFESKQDSLVKSGKSISIIVLPKKKSENGKVRSSETSSSPVADKPVRSGVPTEVRAAAEVRTA